MTGVKAPRPYLGLHSDDDLDLFGAYRQLFCITILGEEYWVPEDNSMLRVFQYLELRHQAVKLRWPSFCWNNTVGCCEMSYRPAPGEPIRRGRACMIDVRPGLVIEELPTGNNS